MGAPLQGATRDARDAQNRYWRRFLRLKLSGWPVNTNDLPGLPPTLTCFEAESLQRLPNYPLMALLPRSLRLSASLAATLPPHMTKVSINETFSTSTWPTMLTSSLTDLTMDFQNCIMLPSDLALLPRSLTRLSLSLSADLRWDDLSKAEMDVRAQDSSIWPSTLTPLKLAHCRLHPHDFLSMPRTLRSLQVGVVIHASTFDSSTLPPHLTRLCLTAELKGPLTFEGLLPPGLTSLAVRQASGGQCSVNSRAIESEFLPSLIELTASLPTANAFDESCNLSRHLQTLSAGCWPFHALRLLPSSLTSLTIRLLVFAPEYDSTQLNLSPHLPTSLTKLKFNMQLPSSFDITPFSLLTRLKHLDTPNDFGGTSIILRYLPRALKTLTI